MPRVRKITPAEAESAASRQTTQPLADHGAAKNGAAADLAFERELWEAAVQLCGTVAPADYKHYVLPLLFLRYLSLRYKERRGAGARRVGITALSEGAVRILMPPQRMAWDHDVG